MQHLLAGEGSVRPEILPLVMPPLVINWHVTEACNYRCSYCYAQWEAPDRKEIIRDRHETEMLVRAIHADFASRVARALSSHGGAQPLRLNFAGGEPLLFADRVLEAMQTAHGLGMDVSLITNGSRLTRHLVLEMAPLLSVLGVSLDAFDAESNIEIGRVDGAGRTPDVKGLAAFLELARTVRPGLVIKVNTVVNARNWDRDLAPVIRTVAPDRWKVLRMLPSTTTDLAIGQAQFDHFLSRHAPLQDVMRVEDNQDMVESYLMIDPYGRFFQNGRPGGGYSYSPPILKTGAASAVQAINWSPVKFSARYKLEGEGRA